ncbi:hypothetical protein N7481_003313 [Penicillium waksmanii]|uniref:uncharacterized protein n=1 Tax=Penicillium waksmanii TaxID=69791 RepID=UPI0025476C67|nr:uncharacterized protein N7481_003313 [Penicillium waksmanii]KAJ5988103.1 hypothetical protein N7481_003313 [Penicillium waksmanii]
MEFEFDHSIPHPGRMGEIYEDQLYHVMSQIRYGSEDGRPLVDISSMPPLVISERNPIRLPEVLASWKRKLLRPFIRKPVDKGKKPMRSPEESETPDEEPGTPAEESEESGKVLGSPGDSRKGSLSSLSLSVGNGLKTVTKPFRR